MYCNASIADYCGFLLHFGQRQTEVHFQRFPSFGLDLPDSVVRFSRIHDFGDVFAYFAKEIFGRISVGLGYSHGFRIWIPHFVI